MHALAALGGVGSAATFEAGQAVQTAQHVSQNVLSTAQRAAANTAAGIEDATQQVAANTLNGTAQGLAAASNGTAQAADFLTELTDAIDSLTPPDGDASDVDQLGSLLSAALELPGGRKLLQAQVVCSSACIMQ